MFDEQKKVAESIVAVDARGHCPTDPLCTLLSQRVYFLRILCDHLYRMIYAVQKHAHQRPEIGCYLATNLKLMPGHFKCELYYWQIGSERNSSLHIT